MEAVAVVMVIESKAQGVKAVTVVTVTASRAGG